MKKTILNKCGLILMASVLAILPIGTKASITVGTIDPNNVNNYVAELMNSGPTNLIATTSASTTINFGKFIGGAAAASVVVTDPELTGYAWANLFGWINLNCSNNASCGSANFLLANDGYGNLSGYGFSDDGGWVNFSPTLGGVIIDNNGQFNGHAWSENFGWIEFDCAVTSTCVETDWRPIPVRPQCNNTLDDDGDGDVDFPADAGCTSLADTDESDNTTPPSSGGLVDCADGADNDGDGLVDFPADPGCSALSDNDETDVVVPGTVYQCSDNIDNDGDGLKDYPADPGCNSAIDNAEFANIAPPVCADGIDNDGDGKKDYPADDGCASVNDNNEDNRFVPPPTGEVASTTPADIEPGTIPAMPATIGDDNDNRPFRWPAAMIIGLIAGLLAGLLRILFLDPLFFSELGLVLPRLLSFVTGGLFGHRLNVTGQVFDSKTKEPLDPVEIFAYNEDGELVRKTMTRMQGTFKMTLPVGEYDLKFVHPAYKFPSRTAKKYHYDGEIIKVVDRREVLKLLVPVDRTLAANVAPGLTFSSNTLLTTTLNLVFYAGFAFSVYALSVSPILYNQLVVFGYVAIQVLRISQFIYKKRVVVKLMAAN